MGDGQGIEPKQDSVFQLLLKSSNFTYEMVLPRVKPPQMAMSLS